MRLKPRTAVAVTAVLIASSVLGAAPAHASVTYQATTKYIGGGSSVNVRSAPSMTSQVIRTVTTGTAISIDCQVVGTRLGFSQYADNRTWDRLTDGRYVHDVVTTTPGGNRINQPDGGYVAWSPTLPRCSSGAVSAGASAAIQWAAAQVGKWQADPVDQRLFTNADWGNPIGEWSGDCPKFVFSAWYHAGKSIATGNAKVVWAKYGSPRNGATTPPAGALVFWPNQSSFGHVALADGSGGVYTTLGLDGARQPIWHGNLNARYGQPTGWAMP